MAATSGAMADFARLPTQRKVLVFVVVGAVLGLLYYQFVLKSLRDEVEEVENEHGSKAAQSAKLNNDIADYDKLKPKFEELQKIIVENAKALPTEAEVPAFFETLNRKVQETGVEVRGWRELAEQPIDAFVKVPVEIELEGTYLQIKRFFASLVQKDIGPAPTNDGQPPPEDSQEERERIVSIEGLTLTNPIVRNREIILTAHFVASTYRQDAPVAPAAVPGAAVPKPNTPAMPSAPSPAAAGTPAGAKAATEKALDQGAQRNSNATGVGEAKTGSATLKGGN
jgi:type IV pilus assembly protein PilO